MGNRLQAHAIERYHGHLCRLGRAVSLEDTARLWVHKYAALWRLHHGKFCFGQGGCLSRAPLLVA